MITTSARPWLRSWTGTRVNEVFVDTSGWAEWLNRRAPFHALATTCVVQARRSSRRVVTTNYVLAELVALLTSPVRLPRPQQIQFLTTLRSVSWVEIMHVDAPLDAAAWGLWQSRPDKWWSLVDCASFIIMQQRGLTEALTTDHHFEQAGFVRLLK